MKGLKCLYVGLLISCILLIIIQRASLRDLTFLVKPSTRTFANSSSLEGSNCSDQESQKKQYTKLQIVYRDLSKCSVKPKYFSQYRAHCWGTCIQGRQCHNPVSYEDTKANARIACFPNLHLAGVRKAGTGDFSLKWFDGHPQVARVQQDYFGSVNECPVEYFSHQKWKKPDAVNGNLYNGGPGNLMAHTKIARNKTHLTLVTGIQFLAYMSTDDTRLYIQLRNPTDRVISNLFYWHQEKLIYTHLPSSALNGGFIDTALQELLDRMQDCLPKYGEAACVYFPDAHDGVVESLIAHSMYIIFIEEMFKLIPRKQFRFKTLDEYSQDRVKTAIDLSENHFGVKFQDRMKVRDKNGIVHHGKKNPVWISTLKLLDDFFMPYNRRLATLLGNDKWLFKVNRTSAL
ncbi:uncharacterized protein [Watersipora subatra]|uniref:uncharacterized protein n=1 Tax=Watersipora subatra TaxID=2589382 RepID=UPI00355B74F1